MIRQVCIALSIFVVLAFSGCASNSGTGGQVVSGILMGIGQGLSGL